MRRCLLALPLLALPSLAHAAPVWNGDMETGDPSQWGYLLNAEINGMTYASASDELATRGTYAARIELHNDAVWGNGLKRVELQHGPEPARTAEGATTWFAWSFYVPETLSVDPSQTIGYWESGNSYQQMMAFEVSGESISFSTRRPMNVVQWQADGMVTAGQWHRIAMRILWSKEAGTGLVDVWFDGDQVVTAAAAQTLADDNPHFTQVGLLRGQIEFEDVPIIFIDDAVEGDSYEDVHPELEPSGGTSTGGADETGPGSEGGEDVGESGDLTDSDPSATTIGTTDPDGTASDSATASGTMSSTTDASSGETTGATAGGDDDDAKGCGCDVDRRAGAAPLLMIGLLALRRRRAGS